MSASYIPWFKNFKINNRSSIKTLCILRSGHCLYNNILFLMKKAESQDYNFCGKINDIHHIFYNIKNIQAIEILILIQAKQKAGSLHSVPMGQSLYVGRSTRKMKGTYDLLLNFVLLILLHKRILILFTGKFVFDSIPIYLLIKKKY